MFSRRIGSMISMTFAILVFSYTVSGSQTKWCWQCQTTNHLTKKPMKCLNRNCHKKKEWDLCKTCVKSTVDNPQPISITDVGVNLKNYLNVGVEAMLCGKCELGTQDKRVTDPDVCMMCDNLLETNKLVLWMCLECKEGIAFKYICKDCCSKDGEKIYKKFESMEIPELLCSSHECQKSAEDYTDNESFIVRKNVRKNLEDSDVIRKIQQQFVKVKDDQFYVRRRSKAIFRKSKASNVNWIKPTKKGEASPEIKNNKRLVLKRSYPCNSVRNWSMKIYNDAIKALNLKPLISNEEIRTIKMWKRSKYAKMKKFKNLYSDEDMDRIREHIKNREFARKTHFRKIIERVAIDLAEAKNNCETLGEAEFTKFWEDAIEASLS